MRWALERNLAIMALRDLLSKKVRLVLNLLGIVIGVSALLFLLSLTEGMRQTILKQLVGSIPITEMAATPAERESKLGSVEQWMAKRGGVRRVQDVIVKIPLRPQFTDETIAEVTAIPGVARVFGVKTLKLVPTSVQGWFFGVAEGDFYADTVVFGYPRDLLEGDVEDLSDYSFRPMGAVDLYPFHTRFPLEIDWWLLQARMRIAERDGSYVPAVISRQLVKAYNMSFATRPGLELLERVSEKSLIGEYMYVRFGNDSELLSPQKDVHPCGALIKVVGLSDRVPMLAFAVPPEYLHLWETTYFKKPPQGVYQQLVVQARTVADVEPVRAALEAQKMEVVSKKETIDKINSVTTFVRFAFVLVVAIILGITAVGILNVLTMSVYEERVDIGILRAVGARQGHVRFIYILKAFIIGTIGSLAGLVLGWAAMWGADALAHRVLGRIAYVPESFFIAQWEFVALSVAMGVGFALLAGISPSNHAARLNPSVALRSV
jgi:ABC-type lipoprotein release transport system permease subunit